MEIQLEHKGKNAIIAYDENNIKIADTTYDKSLLITQNQIITDWDVRNINDLSSNNLNTHNINENLNKILELQPDVVIIGTQLTSYALPIEALQTFNQLQIGVELMPLGSACRTFNVLLSEQRNVVGAFIFI